MPKNPLLWDHSVTSVCKRLGQLGWDTASAKAAIESLLKREINTSTIRTGISDGKNPKYEKGLAAKLTASQIEELARAGRLFSALPPNNGALIQDLNQIEQAQNVDPTTKKALIDARLGQGKFRAKVLQAWDDCCSVTGSTIQAAIRASHIKPWRESSNAERLDPENGLSLIASLDALFDAGLISFDASGRLIASQTLSMKERAIFGIVDRSLKRKPSAQMAEYLAHHRAMNGLRL